MLKRHAMLVWVVLLSAAGCRCANTTIKNVSDVGLDRLAGVDAGRRIVGRVVDRQGAAAVARISINAVLAPSERTRCAPTAVTHSEMLTDSDGRFSIEPRAPLLMVWAASADAGIGAIVDTDSMSEITLVVGPLAPAKLRLSPPRNDVRAYLLAADGTCHAFEGAPPQLVTRAVPDTDWLAVIEAPNTEKHTVPMRAGQTEHVDVADLTSREGWCWDEEGPVSGAEIVIETEQKTFRTRTDSSGRFQIDAVPSEKVFIECSASGRRVEVETADRAVELEFARADGEPEPLGAIAIQVSDSNGQPIREAPVTVFASDRGDWIGPQATGVTNARGLFRMGPDSAEHFLVGVEAPLALGGGCAGTAEVKFDRATLRDGLFALTLKMQSLEVKPFTGRVVDSEGRPVARALVRPSQKVPADCWAGNLESVETNAAGFFTFPTLASQKYQVDVSHPNFVGLRADDLRWRTTMTEIRLTSGADVDGEVRMPDGTHPQACSVWLRDEEERERFAKCDGGGHFSFRALPTRPYHVTVFAGRVANNAQDRGIAFEWSPKVPNGRNELAVDMPKGRTLSGRVLFRDGRPAADASVQAGLARILTARSSGVLFVSAQTGEDGTFTLLDAQDEDLKLVARLKGERSELLEVQHGAPADHLQLRLDATR